MIQLLDSLIREFPCLCKSLVMYRQNAVITINIIMLKSKPYTFSLCRYSDSECGLSSFSPDTFSENRSLCLCEYQMKISVA